MAKARKNYKSKKRYSADQRRAYWIGVGIAAHQYGESEAMLRSHFGTHIKAGQADYLGIKNAGRKFR